MPVIILIGLYIAYMIGDRFINYETLSFKRLYFGWIDFIFGLLIPIVGLALMLMKNKAGWFISTLYFSFATFLLMFVLYKSFTQYSNIFRSIWNVRGVYIFVTSISISILLQAKGLRQLYKINNALWSVVLGISFVAAVVIMYMNA